MTYNITKDDYGVQNCTKGEDVIEEGCSINAFDPDLNPIVGRMVKLSKEVEKNVVMNVSLAMIFPN